MNRRDFLKYAIVAVVGAVASGFMPAEVEEDDPDDELHHATMLFDGACDRFVFSDPVDPPSSSETVAAYAVVTRENMEAIFNRPRQRSFTDEYVELIKAGNRRSG